MSLNSKIRMVLAGLTAVAVMGAVMATGPADAGKKRKHSKSKHHSSKVVQISKGGNATAGNGGAGGAGGSSGNVNNTGNVGGGGTAAGLTNAQAACLGAAVALADAALPGNGLPGPIDAAAVTLVLGFQPAGCSVTAADIPASLLACVQKAAPAMDFLTPQEALDCLNAAGTASGAGGVFSGNGGNGAIGGNGGEATGGAGGNNTNSNTVTRSSDDHSIDVAH